MLSKPSSLPRDFSSSLGARFAVLLGIVLALAIPVQLISGLVAERALNQKHAERTVMNSWGGPISVASPVLIVPVRETFKVASPDADAVHFRDRHRPAAPIILTPTTTVTDVDVKSTMRSVGIYDIPVFTADFFIQSRFETTSLTRLTDNETPIWDEAVLALPLPPKQVFSGDFLGQVNGADVAFRTGMPGGITSGLSAIVGDIRDQDIALKFGLRGADQLEFRHIAQATELSVQSDWPHHRNFGRFLPDITPAEGGANWTLSHLNSTFAAEQRGSDPRIVFADDVGTFGVKLIDPINLYRKAERATKYAILFIALTFLTVFLLEITGRKPVHPVQYLLIGLAQSVFFLLLLALAEHLGFGLAYLAAMTATITLLGYYGRAALELGRRVWLLVCTLALLYAVMFLILKSADYALLSGSVLAFVALAATMAITARANWSWQSKTA